MIQLHTFHIPVLGIGYSIDTPLKVSHYGIDSVISLVDDRLIEKFRKFYSNQYNEPYQEISDNTFDSRAKRITSYLDLINKLARTKINELKSAAIEKKDEIVEYFNLLPDNCGVKQEFNKLFSKYLSVNEFRDWLKENLKLGSIDVNIMTKADAEHYDHNEKMAVEFNDAHAALRGVAASEFETSVVFSAGINTRLFSYMEKFPEFFPDTNGKLKKKIILKVSDFKSAKIQGQFLAKKGLWVSEYRVESGLNCGGHAFVTNGWLMGPILEEFKNKRDQLENNNYELFCKALKNKNIKPPADKLKIRISAQGGVGTAEEHNFLLNHYQLDSVGWGTPFLLVPTVTNVDSATLKKLTEALEENIELSEISPLGIPFNSLIGNTKDIEKDILIQKGIPGSICTRKYAALNKEFSDKAICTASRKYQYLKIKELKEKNLTEEQYNKEYKKIVEKSCICVGLGKSAELVNKIKDDSESDGVAICPGPNMAYFSKILTLNEMIDHIYGRNNVISRTDRPNMFIKELSLYIDVLKQKIEKFSEMRPECEERSLKSYIKNLTDGIAYYKELFYSTSYFADMKSEIMSVLEKSRQFLEELLSETFSEQSQEC